ncbi:MAG: hypothetical protein L0Z62_00710 [Gemmataceae bacterium]|nr:hypothetical protein [Gemmataceae bacterium]
MTDSTAFLRQAEIELRNTRTISSSTCQAWENLSGEARTAFARAMAFLGCRATSGADATSAGMTTEADRIAAARLMLVKLGVDSDDPKWSSDVLDRLLKSVVEAPGGSVGDLFGALLGVLGDYAPELSRPLASFIKELVVKCFTRYQQSYESVNWNRFVESLGGSASKAQLYLALHAIPPQFVSSQLADAIAKGLESTAFRDEAVSALAV